METRGIVGYFAHFCCCIIDKESDISGCSCCCGYWCYCIGVSGDFCSGGVKKCILVNFHLLQSSFNLSSPPFLFYLLKSLLFSLPHFLLFSSLFITLPSSSITSPLHNLYFSLFSIFFFHLHLFILYSFLLLHTTSLFSHLLSFIFYY